MSGGRELEVVYEGEVVEEGWRYDAAGLPEFVAESLDTAESVWAGLESAEGMTRLHKCAVAARVSAHREYGDENLKRFADRPSVRVEYSTLKWFAAVYRRIQGLQIAPRGAICQGLQNGTLRYSHVKVAIAIESDWRFTALMTRAMDHGMKYSEVASKARRIVKHQERMRRRALVAAIERREIPGTITGGIHCGDFRELVEKVPDGSVDLIFTDPPYDEGSIELYGDLAEHAARVLKPGGSLFCYAGHYALGRILPLMEPHLAYWWLCVVKHSGGNRRLPGKWVYVEYKPLLWFVKDGRRDNEYVADFVLSGVPDKNGHEWSQSLEEAEYYIRHLTVRGELVLDPFCGSGTTLLAAKSLGRRYVGFDVDALHVAETRRRLA